MHRQLCTKFSTPLGARSTGCPTKLLKPTFDHNNFEESFSNWEFELQRYENDNTTRLPDQVKIAVLMNETRGPLQQGSTPQCGNSSIIMEYYRTTTAFTRTTTALISCQQQPWRRNSANGHRSSIQRKRKQRQRKDKRQRKRKRIQQRKSLRIWKRLRYEQQRKSQRETTVAASTTSQRTKRKRQERRIQQRKREESNVRLLHLWSTWTFSKRL